MSKLARVAGVVILAGALVTTGLWVARRGRRGASETASLPDTGAPIPQPDVVLGHAVVRAPASLWSEVIDLWQKLGPALLARDGLADLLGSGSGLGRAVIDQVDLKRPFRIVVLDTAAFDRAPTTPVVWAVPLVDQAAFLAALRKSAEVEESGAALLVRAKDARAAARPALAVAFVRGHALIGDVPLALTLARPYLARTLIPQEPEHDVEIRARMDGVLTGPADLDARIEKLKPRLGLIVAGMLSRAVSLLRAAGEGTLAIDVDGDLLTGAIRFAPRSDPAGAPLRAAIARQQEGGRSPPERFGAERMPPGAALVVSDRFAQGARAELAVDLKAYGLDGLMEALTGEVTAALHRPAQAGGVTISVIARARDSTRALAAIDAAVEQATGAAPAKKDGLRMAAIEYRVTDKAKEAATQAFGEKLAIAYGASGDRLGIAAGREAEASARALLGEPKKPSLAEAGPFARAAERAGGRTGLLFVSPVETLRALFGMDPFGQAAALDGVLAALPEQEGVQIDWGAGDRGSSLDITIRVPAGAFRGLAPLLQLAAPMGGLGAGPRRGPGLGPAPGAPEIPGGPKFQLTPPTP